MYVTLFYCNTKMKHESLMYFTTSIDYLMYLLNDAYIISTCQNINIFQNNLPNVSKKIACVHAKTIPTLLT